MTSISGSARNASDEARARPGFSERQRRAADVTEYKRRAGLRGFLDREQRVVQREEKLLEYGELEQRRREYDLQHDAGDHRAPCHHAPVFAGEPGQKKNCDKPECALQHRCHEDAAGYFRRHSVLPPGLSSKTMPASSSSLRMRSVFQHDTFGVQQLFADAVGFGEIPGFARRGPRRDERFDTRRIETAFRGKRLQESIRVALEKAEDRAERFQQLRVLARECDLLSSFASSNSTATASGVLKSSSIASRKRAACGSFQSTGPASTSCALSAV